MPEIAFFEKLGLVLEGVEEVPSQMVKVAFFPCGDTRIELLAPQAKTVRWRALSKKKGEGIQHIAFAVDDLPKELDRAHDNGIMLIDKEPRPGAHHADIAFLLPQIPYWEF